METNLLFKEVEGEKLSKIFHNYPEIKKGNNYLMETEDLHREALKMANLGYWEWTPYTDEFKGSDHFFYILETKRDYFKGYGFEIELYLHPEDKPLVLKMLNSLSEKNCNSDIIFRIILQSGKVKYLHTICRFVGYEKSVNKIIGMTQDITQIKVAEIEREEAVKRLQQLQRFESIGTIAGGIAHDFSNILTAILGYTNIAMRNLEEENRLKQILEKVLQAGSRAKDLVLQMQNISSQNDIKYNSFEVGPIVLEVIRLLRASIPKNILIETDNILMDCKIYGSPVQIYQIILNLLTNASQAIGFRKGIIRISMKKLIISIDKFKEIEDIRPGNYLQICISDDGQGMDKTTLSKIYEPYFTTKKNGEGTGLGLAVVYDIIKSHNGYIKAYSEEGKGTFFSIYFPCGV